MVGGGACVRAKPLREPRQPTYFALASGRVAEISELLGQPWSSMALQLIIGNCVLGHRLKKHVFYEREVVDDVACAQLCLTHTFRCPSCKSVNFGKYENSKGKRKCQLNNKTEENAKPEHLVPDAVFDYWKLEHVS